MEVEEEVVRVEVVLEVEKEVVGVEKWQLLRWRLGYRGCGD